MSSITIGQTPKEWWIRLPTAGHPGSSPRIRDAPTTQVV
ncbi:hypothetical protein JOE58_002439 [Curtobacterium luteum]|uniref:Uncharacterized protein n=1 Tax=Curtobacterium luteum TaxID=33881 RepID=A0ABS2RW08_9MICO|nr:hypothetical protein [Curtobacterium luteum]